MAKNLISAERLDELDRQLLGLPRRSAERRQIIDEMAAFYGVSETSLYRALRWPTLHRDIPGIATGYDWVIIDGPPRVNELARSAIAASDLVVIPVQPSPFDVWAAQDIVSIVGECRISKPEIEAYFVVNRLISGTTLASEIKDAIAEFGLPLFKSVIKNRTGYAKSARYGLTACETDPGGIAATEIAALADEITELMTVHHG